MADASGSTRAGTYDALRLAGLTPELRCFGCRNVISTHVVPWPGDGYVTHPNPRCEAAAVARIEEHHDAQL